MTKWFTNVVNSQLTIFLHALSNRLTILNFFFAYYQLSIFPRQISKLVQENSRVYF